MNILIKLETAFERILPGPIKQKLEQLPEELRKRIYTAVIGISVLLAFVLIAGRLGTVLVAAVLTAAMLKEFSGFVFRGPDAHEKTLVVTGLGWLLPFLKYWFPGSDFALFILYMIVLVLYFAWTSQDHQDALEKHFYEMMASFFGVFYIAFLMSGLVALHSFPHGQALVMLFFCIVWAADSGAYFGGKKYGKTPLFPVLSPKKTIEGLGVGIVSAIVAAIVFKFLFYPTFGLIGAILTAILVSLGSAVGDLFESFMKRAFHTKDSSSSLPGHGGFLDRFDGVVFGLPIMVFCASLFAPM